MTKVATGLALLLTFASWHPPHNTRYVFHAAVNGTFYSLRRPYHLASLVYWDGRMLGAFPSTATKRRGGIVCYKNGLVEAGYFTVEKGKLLWNGAPPRWGEIKWALTGGGLFLLDGNPVRGVEKKENISPYITYHPRYSFLLVHKDRKTVTIGISGGVPPYTLAKRLQGKYYAFLRLDGGSATTSFRHRSLPKGVNNAVGF